jgi:hypothetical protein
MTKPTHFQEGFRACRAGHPATENPYAIFTPEHAAWQRGWLDFDEHQNAKADALDSIGWFGHQ